jgi:uncharacterized DUF497 family protein
MGDYTWDPRKNEKLIRERGVSFEDMIQAIADNGLLDITQHPNSIQYPGQAIYVIQMAGYAYLVPFEESGGKIRLITIIPSRKALRKYKLRGEGHER